MMSQLTSFQQQTTNNQQRTTVKETMMNSRMLTLFVVIAALTLVGKASADTITFDVVADTYIVANDANDNRNDDPDNELIVGYAGAIQRTFIRFDTSPISLPGNTIVTVTSSVLRVTNRNGANGSSDPNVGVYDYAYDFGETTSTWNNPAGDGSDVAGGTAGTLLTFINNLNDTQNVSHIFPSSAEFNSVVEAAITGDGTINLLLKRTNDTGTSNDFVRFRDRDNATGFFQLDVTYDLVAIPEPSTIALAGLGLAGVCLRRRRR
ncbi:MAG: DNRLRE domain-containing protein [Lentisphaeria bacterium]|nr:DNRLRE domain-containing protein [Lentisphaeria bacterium]